MEKVRPSPEALEQFAAELNRAVTGHIFLDWIDHGAMGYVASVLETGLKQKRAVKILKRDLPDILDNEKGIRRSLGDYFATEIQHMASVSHSNVVTVYSKGAIPEFHDPFAPNSASYEAAYYVMEFLEGDNLEKYLQNNLALLSAQDLKDFVTQLAEGVAAVHELSIVHGDLKPQNLVISPKKRLKLTDFGFAKALNREKEGYTFWSQDPSHLHPELRRLRDQQNLRQPEDTRSIIRVSDDLLKRRGRIWELHALGDTIRFVLSTVVLGEQQFRRQLLPSRDKDFLRVTIARLVDERSHTNEDFSQLPRQDSYTSVEELVSDLKKLSRPSGLGGDAPEFHSQFRRVLRVPLCPPVPLSTRMQALIDHPLMQRLADVTQLGVVGLACRAAKHSRFEHSLGVLSTGIEYVRALWYDPKSAYFRQVASQHDCEVFVVAALLHDLGQYPFAHAFEESERANTRLFSHEDLTRRLITAEAVEQLVPEAQLSLFDQSDWKTFAPYLRDARGRTLSQILAKEWGISAAELLSVLTPSPMPEDRTAIRILRHAIDGPIDADKLDYLRRDAYHIGIPNRLDVYDFLRALTTIGDTGPDFDIGITEQGVPVAQDLHMARYTLFVQVYWDRVARSAERMLRYAVDTLREALGENRFSRDFFSYVLTCSDSALLDRLKSVCELEDYKPLLRGCAELLQRVIRRELYQQAPLVVEARGDDLDLHRKLSNFWRSSLESGEAEQWFQRFISRLREGVAAARSVVIEPHEFLLDIPDPRTDQPEKYEIQVQTQSGKSASIQELSPIWREFTTLFRQDGRKIRIFMPPELISRSGINQKTLSDELAAALTEIPAELLSENRPPQPVKSRAMPAAAVI